MRILRKEYLVILNKRFRHFVYMCLITTYVFCQESPNASYDLSVPLDEKSELYKIGNPKDLKDFVIEDIRAIADIDNVYVTGRALKELINEGYKFKIFKTEKLETIIDNIYKFQCGDGIMELFSRTSDYLKEIDFFVRLNNEIVRANEENKEEVIEKIEQKEPINNDINSSNIIFVDFKNHAKNKVNC